MLVLVPPGAVPLLVAAGLLLAQALDWIRRRGSARPPALLDSRRAGTPSAPRRPAAGRAPAARPGRPAAAGRPRSWPAASSTLAAPCCARRRRAASPRSSSCTSSRWFGSSTPVWRRSASWPPTSPSATSSRSCSSCRWPGCCSCWPRDRRKRIEQAQHRLEIAVRERGRLQAAVRRMGDAFAAKLDIDALVDIMLRGSIEALDADAGCLAVRRPRAAAAARGLADRARPRARRRGRRGHGDRPPAADRAPGRLGARAAVRGRWGAMVTTARSASLAANAPFQADEVELLSELVAKAQTAAADILGHHALREEAVTRPADRAGQPSQAGGRRRYLARRRRRLAATADAVRPQRLQGLQRHLRPCGGRRAARAPRRQAQRRNWRPTARPTDSAATSSAPCSRSTPSASKRSIAIAAHALSRDRRGVCHQRLLRRGAAAARGRQPRSRAPTRRRAHVRAQARPLLGRRRPGARRAHAHDAGQAAVARTRTRATSRELAVAVARRFG